MGVGDSLEAAFPLQAPLPAGPWHLVGDGIVIGLDAKQVEVRFDIVWRAVAGDGGSETTLATFQHRFERRVLGGFLATPYAADATGPAAAAHPGDQLLLRITPTAGDPGALFVPNGDGARGQGQIPRIDLPL